MAVTDLVPRNDYVGNGATAFYDFTFPIQDETELAVYRTDTQGDTVNLTYPTDYTVSMLADGTGTIELVAGALANLYTLAILRDMDLTQGTSFTTANAYRSAVHQAAIDRLALQVQQLQEQLDRTPKLQPAEVGSDYSLEIPKAADRAGYAIGFDADGNLAALASLGDGVPTTGFSRSLLDDASRAEARDTLGIEDVYYLPNYGAVGDGVTDDLTAINAAITAAHDAGGGIVVAGPGTYYHSAAITMKTNVTLRGAGRISTIFKSTHTGDGIAMTSTINSSVAVNVSLQNFGLWNTNASNAGGGYVDVGGTFWAMRNVRVLGFKYSVILDQSELADIELCDFEQFLTAGCWLVNGADHTVGASVLFTNRISICRSQFNSGATTYGILDDGGYSHTFTRNNYNGCLTHIRAAGFNNLEIGQSEFESGAGPCILLSNLKVGGAAVGSGICVSIRNNTIVPVAGQSCVSIVAAAFLYVQGNLLGNTAAVKISGVSNVAVVHIHDNYNAGGGATYSSGGTHQLSFDETGLKVSRLGNGAAIQAIFSGTGALNFSAPGAVPGSQDLTISVVGAAVGDSVALGLGVTLPANYTICAWVSVVNVVTVRLTQIAGAAAGQNLGTCRATVVQI